jgi:hypothetical protein
MADEDKPRGETVRQTIERVAAEHEARHSSPPQPEKHERHHPSGIDGAVLALSELLFLLFGLPFGDALYHDKPLTARHWAFLAVAVLCAIGGPMWPTIRNRYASAAVSLTVARAARDARTWIAVLLIFFLNGVAPELFRRATAPTAPATSTTLCWDGPCAPTHKKPGPEYFKEIGLGSGPGQPLMLQAASTATTDRLRVFVDFSEYRNGWMPKTRAFIAEIKEPVKGKTEHVPLIVQASKENAGQNTLWWGDPSQDHAVTTPLYSSNIPAILVRARLAILGPAGEQHHYFMLVRGAENVGTYVGVLPEYDSGDWIESWENE